LKPNIAPARGFAFAGATVVARHLAHTLAVGGTLAEFSEGFRRGTHRAPHHAARGAGKFADLEQNTTAAALECAGGARAGSESVEINL